MAQAQWPVGVEAGVVRTAMSQDVAELSQEVGIDRRPVQIVERENPAHLGSREARTVPCQAGGIAIRLGRGVAQSQQSLGSAAISALNPPAPSLLVRGTRMVWTTAPRRLAGTALAIVCAVLITEALARVAIRVGHSRLGDEFRTRHAILAEQSERIRVLLKRDSTRLLVLDSALGWRYRGDRADSVNGSNAWGARGRREYTPRPRPHVTRVAAFGDSFVYCNEVADGDSWAAQLEQLYSNVEVLNFGVGGYGLDQAYLRFLSEGKAHGSRVMLLGFAPDDLGRLVNVYRRFRSSDELPFFKPRFREAPDGSLELLPNPATSVSFYERLLHDPAAVAEVGVHDEWFEPAVYRNPWYDRSATVRLVTGLWTRVRRRYLDGGRLLRGDWYNVESPAFRIQMRLFQLFADSAGARGQLPLIVFLPDRWTVEQVRAGRAPVYAPFVAALRERGIPLLDAAEAFRDGDVAELRSWFMPGGHYAPAGNRVVAAWLGPKLSAVAVAQHGSSDD